MLSSCYHAMVPAEMKKAEMKKAEEGYKILKMQKNRL
jgi:hypothetical protein